MSAMNIYRHGESEKNRQARAHVVAGRSAEAPLTFGGEAQANKLRFFLARERSIVAAYTSPLVRARQTGSIALEGAEFGVDLIDHDDLQEMSQGVWEGSPRDQTLRLPDGSLQQYSHPRTRGLDGRVFGGESIREVGTRMRDALVEVALAHSNLKEHEDIAIFGHDFAIRCLGAVLSDDIEKTHARIPYCSETRVSYDGSVLLLQYAGLPIIET